MSTTDAAEPTVPAAGDLAPAISLPDDQGRVRTLEERRGRYTLVFFYPKDDTPGCTIEACGFRDAHDEISGESAEVWGISADDAASHQRFRTKFGLPFTLLTDADHAVAEAYGSWGAKTFLGTRSLGILRRSFLIGPDLRIVRVWPKVSVEGHAAEVLEAIRAARTAG